MAEDCWSNNKSSFESQKNVGNLEGMQVFKSIGDKAKVEEKDSGYELLIQEQMMLLRKHWKIMSSSQPKAKDCLMGWSKQT